MILVLSNSLLCLFHQYVKRCKNFYIIITIFLFYDFLFICEGLIKMEIPAKGTENYIPKLQASPVKEAKQEPVRSKKAKKNNKDIYKKTVIRKLGVVDDYARVLNPVLLMSKNPIVRNIAPVAYAASAAYIALDVLDKYNKGEDGTGEKPSLKMGAREALYQTVTSILAPIGIAKGTQKLAAKLIDGSKLASKIKGGAEIAKNFVEEKGVAKSALKYASAPAKILGAVAAIFAISKLVKPIDWVTEKLFKVAVDPVLKIGKNDKPEQK